MPTLGRPAEMEAKNPYRQVQKYNGPNNNSEQLKKLSNKGDYLNRISGNKDKVGSAGVKVVDGKNHSALGKDGFLRLLMNQLSNQDPLKPIDQNKMAADLAQFSQLEQMANMNKNIEKFVSDDIVKKKFFAASFLGKKVITKGSSLKHHGDGQTSLVNFKIPSDMKKGLVRIYDKRKQMIAQIELGARSMGVHTIPWDGKRLDGMDAGKGVYDFQVKAWDQLNNEIEVQTQAEGLVSGVGFDRNGEAVMTVDGQSVYLRDIEAFHLPGNKKPVNVVKNELQRGAH